MSLSTKASLFGGTSISTFGSSSSGSSGFGGTVLSGSSGSSLFSGYGYGTGLLGSTSGLFGYGSGGTSSGSGSGSGGGSGTGSTATNTAPVFTSGITATFPENSTGTVYTASATDADGDTLSYSISGGSDASRFSINSTSGALSFNSSPDFEAPSDSNSDNAYVVQLQATDGQDTDSQTVTISVTDESDTAAALTLTAGTDNFSPTAASTADQTTPMDDTITGHSNDSLGGDDFIDGATGNDSASIEMDNNFGGFSGSGGMQNVEVVTLSSSIKFDREFDATGVSGVTSWVLNHSDEGVISLTALPDTNASISVNDAKDDFTLAWADTTGDQSVTVSMDDVGAASPVVEATLADIEDISLTVTGSNFVNFAANAATSYTISGSGSLDMVQTSTDLSDLDASGMSGNLTADLTSASANKIGNISSGNGEDAVSVDIGDLKASATIDLGGSSGDSIRFAGNANFEPTLAGAETVILAPTAGTVKFNGSSASGIERFMVAESPAGKVTLVNTGTSDEVVILGDGAGQTVYSQATGSLALQFSLPEGETAPTDSATNSLTIRSDAESSLNVTVDSGIDYQGAINGTSVTGTVAVAINGTMSGLAAITANSAPEVNITSVAEASTVAISATAATNLSVSAAANLNLSGGDLTAVETMTLTTNGYLNLDVDFADFKDASIGGTGSVEFKDLGSASHAEKIDVFAVDLEGTDTTGGAALEFGAINTDNGDITVNAAGIGGVVEFAGTVDAGTGDVSIAVGSGGQDGTLDVTGKNVTFDASEANTSVSGGAFNVDEYFRFMGSSMTAVGAVTVQATGAVLDVKLTGSGGENDAIAITAASATTEINIEGGLGAGDDSITVNATAASASITVDASGVSGVSVTMTGSTASDTLIGGASDDNFVLNSGLAVDTIQDFTVNGDQVHFTLAGLNAASGITAATTSTLIAFDTGAASPTDVSTATTVKVATIDDDSSDENDIEDVNIVLLHGGSTKFADVAAAVAAFESDGEFTITHENDVAAQDAFIFAYENSTTGDVHIAAAAFSAGENYDGAAAAIGNGNLVGTDLAQLDGVSDVTKLDAADFDFIA